MPVPPQLKFPRISRWLPPRPELPPLRVSARLRELIAALALLAAGLTGVVVTTPAQAEAVPVQAVEARGAVLTYGQDVSSYQPQYDWAASPAKFGIVKATEGLTIDDSAFARHWKALAEKGIVRGAYHFGHPRNDPVAEADHFLSVVDGQPVKRGDLLVLDLETTDGRSVAEVNQWARIWLAHVRERTGTTPLFYSNWSFADTYGKGLERYPLWVANYSAKGTVSAPADWKRWTILQYSETPVDQNISVLSPAQLRHLGRPSADT
ncbi:hypothetical protein Misp01_42300 [Microtetraspora sp. NBRC 13810]|uniref:glycoside hydrolase family 25 protein n=1 Tax=Microtetraspora sp. NBRC 13810 TaxID=3030990 RepID=UPI0024A15446|nr:GH25 family lysozyme [Microtetraspora sp. NBRC 13810]GLW09101.1 hypothetical protein Misp01_42300 [Microtetraspora sp. NBRC 13810]